MFERTKGRIDAKREIFTLDAATGLALSPFTMKMIYKARKKKYKLTASINGSVKAKGLELRVATSLASISSLIRTDNRSESPVNKGFRAYMIKKTQNDIVASYVALFHLYKKREVRYKKFIAKIQKKLFYYFSSASIYLSIDPKANSNLAGLDPDLREPPTLMGLRELYDRIPKELQNKLPKTQRQEV